MAPHISRVTRGGIAAAIYSLLILLTGVPAAQAGPGDTSSIGCLRAPKEKEERPASKVDTLSVGDALCNMRFRLVEGDKVFSTYVPEQVSEKWTVTGDGASAWFFATTDGKVQQNTYLHIYLPAQKMTVRELRNLVAAGDGMGRSAGLQLTPVSVPDRPEVIDAFSFRSIDDHGLSEGFIHIVDYGDCPFLVMVSSSQENAQTFLPCADRILSEIRWKADGPINTGDSGHYSDDNSNSLMAAGHDSN